MAMVHMILDCLKIDKPNILSYPLNATLQYLSSTIQTNIHPMSILMPDIDKYVMHMLDPQYLCVMTTVNRFFHKIIEDMPIIEQWRCIRPYRLKSTNDQFVKACKLGFIEYVLYLKRNFDIDIHYQRDKAFYECCVENNKKLAKILIHTAELGNYGKIDIHSRCELTFRSVCKKGNIAMAQWLIKLGNCKSYGKININCCKNEAFQFSCANGHIDVAKWLVELGETDDYDKINIHAKQELAFISCCKNGDYEMAKWLVELGENGYGKIDIHAQYGHAFIHCCANNDVNMAKWLVELGETGYGKIDLRPGFNPEVNMVFCESISAVLANPKNRQCRKFVYKLITQHGY